MKFGLLERADVATPDHRDGLLRGLADGRVPIAGGTDLLVRAAHADGALPALVWTQGVAELRRIERTDEGLVHVGAAVSMAQLAHSPLLVARCPALAQAAAIVGSPQIRSRATLAGNLCNASPAADTIAPAIVHGGRAVVAESAAGCARRVGVAEFCLGPGRTVLAPGELVEAVELEPLPAGGASCYRRFTNRRSMDLAFVGVAARLDLADRDGAIGRASIALAAVGPRVFDVTGIARALEGTRPAASDLAAVADAAASACEPISDLRASAHYRRHLVRALVRDCLVQCLRRAAASWREQQHKELEEC